VAAKAFWLEKKLEDMSREEWESLCDGCGRCCLHKLEDEDDGRVYYTNVACQYLDFEKIQCTQYLTRNQLVPHCVVLQPEHVAQFHWLPSTCAYRLVADNQNLPEWHPLVSADTKSVVDAGISIKDRVHNELDINMDDLQEYVIEDFL